jgi:hypothetical protein
MAQILGPNERRGIQDFEINQQGYPNKSETPNAAYSPNQLQLH